MRRLATCLLIALAAATSARGDEAPSMPTQEQSSLQGFAAAHLECREWDDGCATCQRDSAIHCSTPGIACQPREIACKAP
jgi:hypothetical protein